MAIDFQGGGGLFPHRSTSIIGETGSILGSGGGMWLNSEVGRRSTWTLTNDDNYTQTGSVLNLYYEDPSQVFNMSKNTANGTTTEWTLKIDLGEELTLEAWSIFITMMHGAPNDSLLTFKASYSTNDVDYTTIFTKTSEEASEDYNFSIAKTKMRYIKLNCKFFNDSGAVWAASGIINNLIMVI